MIWTLWFTFVGAATGFNVATWIAHPDNLWNGALTGVTAAAWWSLYLNRPNR